MGPKGDRTIAFCGTVEAVYPALTNAQARMPWRDATLRWQGYSLTCLVVLTELATQGGHTEAQRRGECVRSVPSVSPWLLRWQGGQ